MWFHSLAGFLILPTVFSSCLFPFFTSKQACKVYPWREDPSIFEQSHFECLNDELKWMIFQFSGFKSGLRIRASSKKLMLAYDALSKREFEYRFSRKYIRGAFPWPKFRPAAWVLLKMLLPQMIYITDRENRSLIFESFNNRISSHEGVIKFEFFDQPHELRFFFNSVICFFYQIDLSMFMIVMEALLRSRLFKLADLTFPADMDWEETFIEACKERRTILARSVLLHVRREASFTLRPYTLVYQALIQTAHCGDSLAIVNTFQLACDCQMNIHDNEKELIVSMAVGANNLPVIQWLYSRFPEQNWKAKIFTAIELGSVHVLRWLLETLRPDADLLKLGNNILHAACLTNKHEIVKAVVAYRKISLLSENMCRWTPLQILLSHNAPCRLSVKAVIDAADAQGILAKVLEQIVPGSYVNFSTLSMLYQKGLDDLIPELITETINS